MESSLCLVASFHQQYLKAFESAPVMLIRQASRADVSHSREGSLPELVELVARVSSV